MSFETATRWMNVPIPSKDIVGGRRNTFRISKVGLLQAIGLSIKGTIAGTLTSPNALGKAAIVKEVRLAVNTSGEIHRFSGAGYHYLIRDNVGDFRDPVPFTNSRSAIDAATYDVSMFIPITQNMHDQVGLVLLQNEQTEVTLEVEIEADANLATGITSHTCTIAPTCYVFKTPREAKDLPALNLVHSIIEEKRTITATSGVTPYDFPLGDAYLQALLGYGFAVSGTDKFTNLQLYVGNEKLEEWTPDTLNIEYGQSHGRSRLAGTAALDWLGKSGLGSYGSMRDAIASGALTDLQARLTINAAADLYVVRRTLVQLGR